MVKPNRPHRTRFLPAAPQWRSAARPMCSSVFGSIAGGRQTACPAARTTKPAREAVNRSFPRGLFAGGALSAIAQVEETFLPVSCVYRWVQGSRPGGFGSPEGLSNHAPLRQEVNKDRPLRACLEPRNGSTVFNPAGLCNPVFASRLRPEPLGIASRVALHLWRFSC